MNVTAVGGIGADTGRRVIDGDSGSQRSIRAFFLDRARQGAGRFERQAEILGGGCIGDDVDAKGCGGNVAKCRGGGVVSIGGQALQVSA